MSAMRSKRSNSVLNKLGIGTTGKKSQSDHPDPNSQQSWLHPVKDILDGSVTYHAKYLGTTEVPKAKGVEIVKDAIKKLKIGRQVKKSEAGHKGSKLPKVEINISIDSLKVIDGKSRQMICGRPLHRVSYCADDHSEKKLFAFIAKDQETKKHHCFVFICEKMASELTLTLGQAFQMAYRRYVDKEKSDIKKNKEMISLEKEIKKMKEENVHLKKELNNKNDNEPNGTDGELDTSTKFFNGSSPPTTPQLQSLTNPFPTSPRTFDSLNSPMDASFTAHFPLQIAQEDDFDPFGNVSQELDFGGGISSSKNDDFFGDSNGGISVFDINSSSTAALPDTTAVAGFDFEPYDFGSSPREHDFTSKIDPFADTPDWESVASEEVTGSVSSQPTSNPFADTNALEKDDPFGNQDPFGRQDPFAQNDPFGHQDPFAKPDIFTQNPFSTQHQQPQTQQNNSLNFDIVQTQQHHQNQQQQPQHQPNTDLFSQYLSTVAARGDNEILSSNTANNNTASSMNTINTDFFNSLDTPPKTTISTPQNNIIASNTLNNNSSSILEGDFSLLALQKDIPKSNSLFHDTFNDDVLSPRKPENNSTQTARPRPSGVGSSNQSLPAPPTKKAVKSILKPTTTTPQQSPRPTSIIEEPKPVQTPPPIDQSNYSSSHVLPNVRLAKVQSGDPSYTRSRTRSQNPVRPLKDSIQNASKSLEDLVGLDEPVPSNQQANPFQQQEQEQTLLEFQNSSDFFKEVHSPDATKPSFASPYSTFEATI